MKRIEVESKIGKEGQRRKKKDSKPEVKVKSPKLEITKFKRNHLDWRN